MKLEELISHACSDAVAHPLTIETVELGDTIGLTASVTVRESE